MVLVRGTRTQNAFIRNLTVNGQDGIYDLTGIQDWNDLEISLPPDSVFPGIYLTPETITSVTPEHSSQYELHKTDYLTQQFHINVPNDNMVYTLDFTLSGRHAIKAYINGKLAGQIGTPGATKETTDIGENHLICYAAAQDGSIDIILQCAQFYHYKYNGSNLATIKLYQTPQTPTVGISIEDIGFFLIGGLLTSALFLLGLFFFNRRNYIIIYFFLTCLTMAIRECIQSQIWFKFPFISGNVAFKLEYISVVLITVFLTLYLGELLKGKLWIFIKYIVIFISVIYLIFICFGNSLFYTTVLKYYQAILLLCIFCAMIGLFKNISFPNREKTVTLYGISVFYLACVSDILMYNNLSLFFENKVSVTEAAMLVFVLAETVSLFLMNIRIVKETKEKEKILSKEKEVLESISRLKTEFLGNVSHELKTPLTVISSYAQYSYKKLEQEKNMLDLMDYMKLIESESQRLAMMVTQILDVTKIEENKMVISQNPCSLINLIQYTLVTYQPIFTKNGNRLMFQPGTEPITVLCDRDRIIQVLVNLIGNATKHTKDGTIRVLTEKKNNHAFITISDTGTGIEQEKLKYLFNRYYTGEPKNNKMPETGTGLGLYVCKHIIKEHGGEISVESELGKGTSVTFTLLLN